MIDTEDMFKEDKDLKEPETYIAEEEKKPDLGYNLMLGDFSRYTLAIIMILFFLLAIYIISYQAEKIGYYNACKERNLNMTFLTERDGTTRVCMNLTKRNQELELLAQQRFLASQEVMNNMTAELLQGLNDKQEVNKSE